MVIVFPGNRIGTFSLIELMDDPDSNVCPAAIYAMVKIGGPR
jgi:HEAT repeat protein